MKDRRLSRAALASDTGERYSLWGEHHGHRTVVATGESEQHENCDVQVVVLKPHGQHSIVREAVAHHEERKEQHSHAYGYPSVLFTRL